MIEKKLKFLTIMLSALALLSYLLASVLFMAKSASASKVLAADNVGVGLVQKIRDRGYIKCGVATSRPGYSSMLSGNTVANEVLDESDYDKELYDNSVGIEADMCRAVAVGLFGETQNRLYFKNLDGNWNSRMSAVEEGEVDLLFRGTSLALELGLTHRVSVLPVIYFEPIILLVPKAMADTAMGIPDNVKVCAIEKTFSYNAASQFADFTNREWLFPPAFSPAANYTGYTKMLEDYKSGTCQVLAGRYSSIRNVYINHNLSEEHNRVVLGDAYHVPIAGVVRAAERDWHNLVAQSIWTTMKAQHQGFTSESVAENFNAKAWSLMNLDQTNPAKIVKQIGSYAEIYQRNMGDDMPGSGPNNHFLADPAGRLLVPH